jgi:HAD superfamily hydrolase (TIGR01509 family)
MPAFDSILFDFDGVLLDTEPVHWACWAQVLAPLGVTLSWEFYRGSCIGIDDREMLRMMATQSDPPRDWTVLWQQYPAKQELFRARMETAPPFDAGVSPLLSELEPRYLLAVVSSSACREIEPLLEAAGLRGHFQTVVGGDSVKRHKPDPEPYLLAANRLRSKRPLVLEDSPAGLASGRAAGFEVLAIPHPADMPALLRARLRS